jgi:ElaB/YqjD/DUF883 family membrane-anchored ribosome-binding protein
MSTHDGSMTAKRAGMSHSSQSTKPAMERIGTQAKEMGKDLHEMGGTAVEALQEKIGELHDTATEYYEQGKGKFSEVERSFGKFVKEQPLKSVLIAAAAGWLFGRFWMRR